MFDTLVSEFIALGTPIGIIALVNIIFIDIVMSGDNALLIGLATKDLAPKDRKKAIFWWVILATVLRIIFALSTVFLLGIPGVKLMGGLLLLYVVVKLYRDLRAGTHDHESLESAAKIVTLRSAITSIIIADVSMSLDNVLAVAGAAHGNTAALGIGLIISIILMAVASNYMATLLKRYPWIAWLGLLVLLYVTLQMLYQGYIDAATRLFV